MRTEERDGEGGRAARARPKLPHGAQQTGLEDAEELEQLRFAEVARHDAVVDRGAEQSLRIRRGIEAPIPARPEIAREDGHQTVVVVVARRFAGGRRSGAVEENEC